jgi:hypothetical protein
MSAVFVDPELKNFAESAGPTKRSVILETISNPVSVPARLKTNPAAAPKRGKPPELVDESAAFEALARELDLLQLAEEPVRLEGVRSFVVELTPQQLGRVLELPMVAAVRLNRTHRAPRGAGA